MKKLILLASAFSAAALVACTEHGSSDAPPAQGVLPTSLSEHALVSKPPLTPQEKFVLKSFSDRMQVLPDPTAVGDEKGRRRLTPAARMNLKRLQAKCDIVSPKNRSQDPNPYDNVKPVDTVTVIAGRQCPINYRSQTHSETVNQTTSGSDSVATFVTTARSDNRIVARDLQAQSGTLGSTVVAQFDGTISRQGPITRSFQKGTSQFVITLVDGRTVTVDMRLENVANETLRDSYVEATFNMGFATPPTLQMFQSRANGTRAYLNGQPISELELKQLFGSNFKMMMNTGSF
jgi:hypothetical protein